MEANRDCPKEITDFLFDEFSRCQNIPPVMFYKIARHRRHPLVGNFAALCFQLIAAHRNWSYNSLYNGEYFLLQRLQESGIGLRTIFDVGANVGDWSLKACECFPEARVHCFEILPDLAEELTAKVQGKQAVVNTFGLLDFNGETEVRYYPNRSEFSSVIPFPHGEEHSTIKAQVMKGDDYLQKHGIARIDFLKLDVEGAEPGVLDGFSEIIGNEGIDVIQFEYGKINILTRFLLLDFYQYFSPRGYRIGKIFPNYVDFKEYDFDQEDFLGPSYLAVSNRRRDIIDLLQS